MSIRSGSSRVPVAPLAALFTLAMAVVASIAQSSLCTRPVVLLPPGTAMRGMDMPATPGGVMICPVVLALVVLATLLSAWSLVTVSRDTQRALTVRTVLRSLAALPPLRTFAVLALCGGVAAGAIAAVDGHAALGIGPCLELAAVLAVTSLAATLAAIGTARAGLAFFRRLLAALVIAIADRRPACRTWSAFRRPALRLRLNPLSRGRGLRAPPAPAS